MLRAARAARLDADVVVIGAGLSGLQAAVILQDEGADVLVVEGNDRVGGRVWSLDNVPGKPEAGGAEIGPGYARMHAMIARLGGIGLSRWLKYHADRSFALYEGDRLYSLAAWQDSPANRFSAAERKRFGPGGPFDVAMTYLPVPSPLPGLESWLDPEAAALDLPLDQYLRQRGASEEALRFAATTVPADSIPSMSALFMLRSMRFMQEMGPLDGLQVFDQGTSRVPEGMAALLKREVRTRAPVAGLRTLDDCAEVLLADGTVLRAERIICTVPLPALRGLGIEPALPPLQAEAVKSTPYGSALSIFFAIKEPFWEQDGLPPSTWSRSAFGKAFVRSSPRGQHLWFHKSGIAGLPLKGLTDAEIRQAATAELHEARPSTKGRVEATAVVNWNASPWVRGHLAHRGPGQVTALGHVVARPHGRIHFAGEHTAVTMMGMEGAMESGERAAVEVLGALA
jgi:monoamine oxidase